MSKAKRSALLLLSTAGILVLLLVMSLPDLTLSSGKSFVLGQTDVTVPGTTGTVSGHDTFFWLMRGIVALSLVGLGLYVVYSLFSVQERKRLVTSLIAVVLLFALVSYLERHPLAGVLEEPEVTADETEDEAEAPPSAVFSEDEAPGWLAVPVIVLAALFSVGLLMAGLRLFRLRRAAQSPLPVDPLAEIAQDTLDSLQTGGDFKRAILRCYYEMNRVIREERGLAREASMTPREFEQYLAAHGIPRAALQALTRLFEQVRYGGIASRADDEALAFACLNEIIASCTAAPRTYARS